MKKKIILVVIVVFAVAVSGVFVLTKCLKTNSNHEQVNVVEEKDEEFNLQEEEQSKDEITTETDENENKTANGKSESPKEDTSKQENKSKTSTKVSETPKKTETKSSNVPTTSSKSQEEKQEFSSESEALRRGTEIQNKELDYVLDWNEEHPDNQIQPEINYFRVYPSAIDENGKYWYYLHFFCRSGEGLDQELKSKY